MQRYSIAQLIKMKKVFTEQPDQKMIVGYTDFKQPIIQDLKSFKIWFLKCLNEKINVRGKIFMPRKWKDQTYQTDLKRDKWSIEDRLQKRIRIYQFNTKVCQKRLNHLMSDRNEV